MLAHDLGAGSILAVSDLHVNYPPNRALLSRLTPSSRNDWLLVCGDLSDDFDQCRLALTMLRDKFSTVIWVPGNHELWTYPEDKLSLRGEYRYRYLVDVCRSIDVVTPEDPYPLWDGRGGPATIVPLFLLYDYSFGVNVGATKSEALERAHEAGVVSSDEFLLYPDPYPSREAWCHERLEVSEASLATRDLDIPTVLVNHFPLTVAPTRTLLHPEFAQWCGTALTEDWHRRYGAVVVVYGHLHIPRTTWEDGVRFEEVSLGYPQEWERRQQTVLLRQILPERTHH